MSLKNKFDIQNQMSLFTNKKNWILNHEFTFGGYAKYNKELVTNLASANAQARAGEIEQKTYSGYDLGRNVVARYGGNRLQMPKYA